MTALWIVLGVTAFIALVLCLTLGVDFRFDRDGTFVQVIIGFLKIKVVPGKDKKNSYKKLAKKLRGQKISEMTLEEKKKKKPKEKKKNKTKFIRTGNSADDFISAIAEMSNEPEALRLLLTALKELAEDFKRSLRVKITKLIATIDTGDAAKTCITCGALSQLFSFFLEFADCNSRLTPVEDGSVGVFPAFDGSGYNFDIGFTVKTRVFHILKAFFASMNANSKIKKQYTPQNERTEK